MTIIDSVNITETRKNYKIKSSPRVIYKHKAAIIDCATLALRSQYKN